MQGIIELVLIGFSVLIASTVHEYAHALVAYKLGDITPKAYGRLTLNPVPHIDPIGALSFLIFRFGWSKPVPINSYNFKNEQLGIALTSLAGPLSNVLFVIVLGFINSIIATFNQELGILVFGIFMRPLIIVNIALAIFNLIPIPPLDGSKILYSLLPADLKYIYDDLEQYGIIILLLLVLPISPLSGLFSSILTGAISLAYNIFLGFVV